MPNFYKVAVKKLTDHLSTWFYRDKRVLAIICTAIVMALITLLLLLILWLSGYDFTFERFVEPIIASWMAGAALLIFSVFIAAFSLRDPSREDTEERLNILLQRKRGPHISYFKKQFEQFEHFSELTKRRIVVKDISEDSSRLSVEVHSRIQIRNFIDDISSEYLQRIILSGAGRARLAYLRVDGVPRSIELEDRENHREAVYPVAVPAGQMVEVEFSVNRWIEVGEEDNMLFTPSRFTRCLVVVVENEVNGAKIVVRYKKKNLELLPSAQEEVLRIAEIKPGDIAYRLKISPSCSV